jgi:bacterioferritin-associated ferredoxin
MLTKTLLPLPGGRYTRTGWVGEAAAMIVCSCNILSDQDVRAIASNPAYVPPRVAEIYDRLGCSAECGRCARTIKMIIEEAAAAMLSVEP